MNRYKLHLSASKGTARIADYIEAESADAARQLFLAKNRGTWLVDEVELVSGTPSTQAASPQPKQSERLTTIREELILEQLTKIREEAGKIKWAVRGIGMMLALLLIWGLSLRN